jgi:hypothetical protein
VVVRIFVPAFAVACVAAGGRAIASMAAPTRTPAAAAGTTPRRGVRSSPAAPAPAHGVLLASGALALAGALARVGRERVESLR